MIFREEPFEGLIEEFKVILPKHWEELANYKDIRPLDVSFDSYTQLNRLGVLRVFVCRGSLDNKLIGYASFMISPHLHYQNWKYALCDVYYLDPAYRNRGTGTQFFQEIEKWLRELGAQHMVIQDKVNHSHESMFVKMGYTLTEQNYEKLL